MISSLAWVRRGASQRIPDKYELTEEELSKVKALTDRELALAKKEYKLASGQEYQSEISQNTTTTTTTASSETHPAHVDDELKKYNLDAYDAEEADEEHETSFFGRVKGLSYYTTNNEDPYITFRGPSGAPLGDALTADEEALDREDLAILPTDNLILVARTEDEVSQLEVCVYEGEDVGNIYVHHDLMLPAFPLCLEWLDFRVGRKKDRQGGGNYVAVGTFDPEIEIWDLDTTDAMYPDAILGGIDTENNTADASTAKKGKKGKKAKKSKNVNKDRHVDAVLDLAWNPHHRNLLASASADTTVKLWDLQTLRCSYSYEHHTDKVQAIRWHPTEGTVLLTGSFDKTVAVLDSRAPTDVARWRLQADVETLRWDPFISHLFYVSNEAGMVQCFDARSRPAATETGPSQAVFTLHAHDGACSGMDFSPLTRGLMATGSTDKTVKIWDVLNGKPKMILSRNLGVGKIFSLAFSPDSPLTLAAGGSAGKTQLWDVSTNAGARRAFEDRGVSIVTGEDREELVGLVDDAEESEDEEEVVAETSRGGAGESEEGDDAEEMMEDADGNDESMSIDQDSDDDLR